MTAAYASKPTPALSGSALNISLGAGMCLLIACVFSVIWLLVITAAWLSGLEPLDQTLGNQWITQSLLMVFIVLLTQASVAEAQSVLQARVAPVRALRASVRALRLLNWQAWVLCALPLLLDGLRRAMAGVSITADQTLVLLGAGPAWLLLLMLAGAWFSAAWQGRLSGATSALVALICAALCLRPVPVLEALRGVHGPGLALALQSFAWIGAIWGLAPAMERPQSRVGAWPWLRSLSQHYFRSFNLLDKSANPAGGWLFPQILWMNLSSQTAVNEQFMSAHPSLGNYLLRLLLLSLIALTTLQCRHLHWRYLLAPRGPQRAAMGIQVLRDTLAAYLRLLPFAALFLMPLYLLVASLDHHPQWMSSISLQASVLLGLLLDVLLCTLLATLLRGLLRSQVAALGLLAGVAAAGLLAWALHLGGNWASTPLPRNGFTLGFEAVLVLALLPALRPAWFGVDLAALLRRNAAALEKRRQRQA